MNILNLLWENLLHGPVSFHFPQHPASPAGLRGLVQNDPERCTGCGTCAYVCAPAAIQVRETSRAIEWEYDPGQCTFCGRCVSDCPLPALAWATEPPPPYTSRNDLRVLLQIDFPACTRCGQPTRPVNLPLLQRAYPEISERVRSWSRLCTHCRQAAIQHAFVVHEYLSSSSQPKEKAYDRG